MANHGAFEIAWFVACDVEVFLKNFMDALGQMLQRKGLSDYGTIETESTGALLQYSGGEDAVLNAEVTDATSA